MKIILGTSSKWRRKVFDTMGYSYEVISPKVNEASILFEDPDQRASALAKAKIESIALHVTEPSLIIAADLVVVANHVIRSRPQSKEEAAYLFGIYAKYPVETHSAIIVMNTKSKRQASGVDVARVYFKPIPDEVIQKLIKKGAMFSAPGGIQVEDELLKPYVDKIEGTVESLVGMPKELVIKLIAQAQQE